MKTKIKNVIRTQVHYDPDRFVCQVGATVLQSGELAVIYNETEYGRGLARSLVLELKNRNVAIALEAEVKEGQNRFADIG